MAEELGFNMSYTDIAKKLGLDALEKAIFELVIPYIDDVIQKSENKIDDSAWGALRPMLLEMIDKLDGEKDLE